VPVGEASAAMAATVIKQAAQNAARNFRGDFMGMF